MATRIKGRKLAQLLQAQAVRRSDQVMSRKSMQAYLRYRLVVVEGDIRQIMREMGVPGATGPDTSSWAGAEVDPAFVQSWTSLNYLLSARDALRGTLAAEYDTD